MLERRVASPLQESLDLTLIYREYVLLSQSWSL